MLSSFVPDLINRKEEDNVNQVCKTVQPKSSSLIINKISKCKWWKLSMMLKLRSKARMRTLLMERGDQIRHHRKRH